MHPFSVLDRRCNSKDDCFATLLGLGQKISNLKHRRETEPPIELEMSESKRHLDGDREDDRSAKRATVGIAGGGGGGTLASRPTIRYYCPSKFAQECHAAFPRHIPQLLADRPDLDFFDDKASCEAKTRCGGKLLSSGIPTDLQREIATLLPYTDLARYWTPDSKGIDRSGGMSKMFPYFKETYTSTDRLIRQPISGPQVLALDDLGRLDDLVGTIDQRSLGEVKRLIDWITNYRLQDRLSDQSKIKIISQFFSMLYMSIDAMNADSARDARESLNRIATSHWINSPKLAIDLFKESSLYPEDSFSDVADELVSFWRRLIRLRTRAIR